MIFSFLYKAKITFAQHTTALLDYLIRPFFDNTPHIIYGVNSENMHPEEAKSSIDFTKNKKNIIYDMLSKLIRNDFSNIGHMLGLIDLIFSLIHIYAER